MAWDVHIHVCFGCDRNEGVAALAEKHRPQIEDAGDGHRAAQWFLDDLSGRTGHNRGPKGGLSLWGMVGNYTNVGEFCEVLKPFWADLFSVDGGPLSHEHVIVFGEPEQSEAAAAYEISYDESTKKITIREHAGLPFAWMQF